MGNKNKLNKQVKQSTNEAYNSFKVVLFYCLLIIFLPIVSFFTTKYIVESNFDVNQVQANIYSAISAVIGLHIALGLYIAKAYFSEPSDIKQDKIFIFRCNIIQSRASKIYKMDVNIKINQKVILDLGVESFVGNVSSIDSNFTRIRLKNVENLQTKIKYRGTQNFYFSKIKSITPLLDDSIQINDLESTSQSLHENNHTENINEKNVKIGLSEQEWDTINFTLDSIRVLDKNDASYFNAIKDLANQQSFIILMEDCDFGRNNNVSNIITLYSPATKLVYIFNMVCMRKLQKELHHILKLEKPKKIVFNSKILRDHLKLAQNIEDINGIFDVLAAYLIAFRKNESLDLISCVHKCFFIPENYFKTEIKYNWLSRPLNIDHIEFKAKKAIFLYKLYEYLLHKHLLKTFYQTCQTFSLSLCSIKDNVEVAYLMSNSDKTVEKLVQETDVELSFSTDQLKLSENNARK